MQVTETLSEGLKREFKVVVPAAELDAKVNVRLDELKDRVRINGFRPGKVPVAHLKRVYGRSAMAEVIEATVRDTNNQIVSERGFKLAADPKVTLPTEEAAVEKLIAGKSDLDYTMAVEIVPPIELANFKTIKLDKLTSDVTDAEIDEAVARITEQNKPYTAKSEGGKAAKGDRVVISFAGTIDGQPFEGGTATISVVLIGSNTFIPGFEDQLDRHRRRRNAHTEGDVPGALSESGTGRQERRIRRYRQIDRNPRHGDGRRAFAKSLALNRSPSCATRSRSALRPSMPACRGRRSSASCSTNSIPGINSSRRRHWSRTSSTGSGSRCKARWKTRRRLSPTRAPPRIKPRPNTAPLPSGACGLAWCWPKSARRTRST